MRALIIGIIAVLSFAGVARGDEGMWLLNDFPAKAVNAKYGFAPDQAWLDFVRLSSLRLAGGCSGSFVSAEGLVMTNHHCAHSCIAQVSTAKDDKVKKGFYARTAAEEVKCPEIEINQLSEITDVTARMNKATAGLEGKAFGEAQRAEMARIEKECATSPKLRCDVVTLYHGGAYHLYKYRRFQDVRLVFAPEFDIAFFGGDPDNFNFPRYDLDVSFLRVYEDGKPLRPREYFSWSAAGAKEGELTFVTGHPWSTSRLLTIAELEYLQDIALPERLFRAAELRGQLTLFARRGAEQWRIAEKDIFGIENSFKALKGRYEALLDRAFMKNIVERERALRSRVQRDPQLRRLYAGAWDEIAKRLERFKALRKPYREIEVGFDGKLFGIARTLVRGSEELTKPNEQRLAEYRESALPGLKQGLFSSAPIYDELEVLKLTFSFTKLRESLGADDPLVRRVLGKESPEELATRLVRGTKLKDVNARQQLWKGGKSAVAASTDPLIELARRIDPQARALRQRYEDEIEAALKKQSELIAKARFAVYGTGTYPDASATLRVSYGQVKGYEENGHKVQPITTISGAFARHTGRPPVALPASWLRARDKLNLETPLNFCSTNDIIGGNSGSPVINRDKQIVGLIFDGNIQSLGGDFGFDESVNRAVAVHSQGLIEALDKIYGASRIVLELRPRSGAR